MLIKQLPEDFVVKEVLNISPGGEGAFAVYMVTKRGLSTPEVLQALARALGLRPSQVTSPALKDAKALSSQHLCVGPIGRKDLPRKVFGEGFSAELIGFLERRLGPRDLKGNLFRITLRKIKEEELPKLLHCWQMVLETGFPNYFDLQRFGSWSPSKGFPGKALLLGQWEEALRFYLLYPTLGDPKQIRQIKEGIKDLWGQWEEIKRRLPRSNQRSVVNFLCSHPLEFKKATNLISPRILSLWLSSYQAFLWNQWISRWLKKRFLEEAVAISTTKLPFQELVFPKGKVPKGLLEGLSALQIPLPSNRTRFEDEDLRAILEEVLKEEGLLLEDLKARGLKKAYLSKGKRTLWAKPEGIRFKTIEDELFRGYKALVLEFFLPAGSYATMAIKALWLVLRDNALF